VVEITQTNFDWVEELKEALKECETNQSKLLVVSQGEPHSGIIGMVNCLKQEPGGNHLR
jgi:fatty acid synthase